MSHFFEKMWEYDKRQHFCYSLAILLLLLFLLSWPVALISTVIIGLLKEIWDHYWGSGFCWYDMAANGLGIILGMLLALPVMLK